MTAARQWMRFAIIEVIGGAALSLGALLWEARAFRRWPISAESAPNRGDFPTSLADPNARVWYMTASAAGAALGVSYVAMRPLLPKRPEAAGAMFGMTVPPLVFFGASFGLSRLNKLVDRPVPTLRAYARSAMTIKSLRGLRSTALFGVGLGVLERAARRA